MLAIIIALAIAALCCLFILLFHLFSNYSPKWWFIAVGVALVGFMLWSWWSYPDLEPETVKLQDYGTIVNITPGGGRSPVMVETSSGSMIRIYPDFPLHEGDAVLKFIEFDGGEANRYYTIAGKRDGISTIEWNMPGWSKTMQHYPK